MRILFIYLLLKKEFYYFMIKLDLSFFLKFILINKIISKNFLIYLKLILLILLFKFNNILIKSEFIKFNKNIYYYKNLFYILLIKMIFYYIY